MPPKKKSSAGKHNKKDITEEKKEKREANKDDTELDYSVDGVEEKSIAEKSEIDGQSELDNQSISEGIDEQSVVDEVDYKEYDKEQRYKQDGKHYSKLTSEKKKQEIPRENYEYKPATEKRIIIVDPMNRITSEVATFFEVAEIIGQRAKQIENGSPCYVNTGTVSDPITKAKIELRAKRCPLTIMRQVSENIYEKWNVNDMTIEC